MKNYKVKEQVDGRDIFHYLRVLSKHLRKSNETYTDGDLAADQVDEIIAHFKLKPIQKRSIPNSNNILQYLHCGMCLDELLNNPKLKSQFSPQTYSRLECGWTKLGFQVWCYRHNVNVLHVDFEGVKHTANTTRKRKRGEKKK